MPPPAKNVLLLSIFLMTKKLAQKTALMDMPLELENVLLAKSKNVKHVQELTMVSVSAVLFQVLYLTKNVFLLALPSSGSETNLEDVRDALLDATPAHSTDVLLVLTVSN